MKASSCIFLSYAMSLAVCETISRNFHVEGYIKWPNDILLKTKKWPAFSDNFCSSRHGLGILCCGSRNKFEFKA